MQEENQDALREFNEQWDKQHTSATPTNPADGNTGNTIQGQEGLGLEDQLAAAKASLNPGGVYQPPTIPTTGDSCHQCGTMHPPVRPGEVCPVAAEMGKVDKDGNHITAQPEPASDFTPPEKPAEAQPIKTESAPQPLTEGNIKTEVKNIETAPARPATSPPAPQPAIGKAEPEPEALAENNIPTEVHVNKYLNHWGTIIEAHCKTHGIVNVKRLMRHLTVEVTDFLEHNKGR